MKRDKSKINGVKNEYRQLEGRCQFFQVCQCSKCSTTIEFSTKSSPMPRSIVFNKMRDNGWLPYSNGAHVCPACRNGAIKKSDSASKTINVKPKRARGGKTEPRPVTIHGIEYPTLRAAADALGMATSTLHYLIENNKLETYKPRKVTVGGLEYPSMRAASRALNKTFDEVKQMINMKEVNTVTHEQKAAPQPPLPDSVPISPTGTMPREMSREHRRRIWRYLEEVYDVVNGRYIDANTDHVVAEHLKVPRAWVVEVRDEVFGPEGGNDEMEKLRKEIATLSERLTKAVETCLNAATDAEALQGEVKRMEARFRALRDLVGPQAHKVK